MAYNRLVFTEKECVQLQGFNLRTPEPHEVAVTTTRTLISTGTETIVFGRRFDPGTHWDQWVTYPFFPGYSCVGVISAIGTGVDKARLGQRVCCRKGHASHHLVPADAAFPIPDAIADAEACWFALAKIAFLGIRAADIHLGSHVAIIGAGPIGQMATRWAHACGAEAITVIDPDQARLPHAQRGGATACFHTSIEQVRTTFIESADSMKLRRPEIVIDTTGNAQVFAQALTLVADRGRVVILGDTGSPNNQHITKDVITRGLSIVGAHDMHITERWHDETITKLFFALVANKQMNFKDLCDSDQLPTQASEVYARALNHRQGSMGLSFTWSKTLSQAAMTAASDIEPGRAAPTSAT